MLATLVIQPASPPTKIPGRIGTRQTIAWALSPNNRFAATLNQDGRVNIWTIDIKRRHPLATRLRTFKTPSLPYIGRPVSVLSIAPKADYIALRRTKGDGYDIFRTRDGKRTRHLKVPNFDYSWESRWLPSGSGVLVAWGAPYPKSPLRSRLFLMNGKTMDLPIGAPWAFTPDGRSVLGPSKEGPALLDLATQKIRVRFKDSAETMPPFVFSKDGRFLVSIGEDPAWRTPEPTEEMPFITESAFAHMLKIKIWNAVSGKCTQLLDGYSTGDSNLSFFFLDRNRLVLPDLGRMIDARDGKTLLEVDPIAPHTQGFLQIPPLPDEPLRPRVVEFP